MNLIPRELLDDEEPRLEKGFEWVDGQAVEKPMGTKSGVIGASLTGLLYQHVTSQKLGFVVNSEGMYEFGTGKRKQIRKPDVSFVAQGRLPNNEVPDGNMTVAPDLAVEVVSPNDLAEEIERRVDDFLREGTKLFWVVYPKTRSVYVLRQDGTGARLTENKDLSGENVVPGFTCRVADLFQGL